MTITATEQAGGLSGVATRSLVHYALTFLPPYLGTSNCLRIECHRGKSGRRELDHSPLTYWVLPPVPLQFPAPAVQLQFERRK